MCRPSGHFVQLVSLAQSSKWNIDIRMKLAAALVPYVAVLLGMKVLGSAWSAILLYHAGIFLFLVFGKRCRVWKTVFRGNTPILVPAVILCSMAAPVVYFLWPWFGSPDIPIAQWLAKYGLTGISWTLLIPYFSIIHPILEEVHWRGMAPEQVKGSCWQDFLFAGYHVLVLYELVYWPWLFLVFGVLVGSSFFWRWAADRFGGYLLPVVSHVAADAGVLVGVIFLLRG
jgi:membrane protease YdiL (CAAX protease family)